MIEIGEMRIVTLGVEKIVVIKWPDFRKLLNLISREGLIIEFAPDKETASSWKKNVWRNFYTIDEIQERYSVK